MELGHVADGSAAWAVVSSSTVRQMTANLSTHLETGTLRPIPDVAQAVLGHRVTARTALRWAVAGCNGVRLPTRRGVRRARCTTEATFRAWLAARDCADQPPQKAPGTASTLGRFGLAS
jgi:hypothetical protein